MAQRLFYGWIIVGTGIVVTCIGVGAMLALSIFLQPISEATGWSRTGVSTAALLNWLAMGVGSFVWGALSDRFGTRTVVLCGGGLLGLGLVTASQATTLGQFQLLFGVLVGLASGSFFTPLTATTTRWFTRNRSLAVSRRHISDQVIDEACGHRCAHAGRRIPARRGAETAAWVSATASRFAASVSALTLCFSFSIGKRRLLECGFGRVSGGRNA